ncbi:Fur family transcriptional regulator [Coraliomargarita akajimensis]|uniref:Ferric uptake regulator, Fur family n=1 Tax=Coraliomargarita akajimensis (strain DSM 45221 / IAM 15411 / JCM 23193 / KCTC 12865 / 04OKA010-24) TaxID=583355 RepID=D5ELB4_CORAD|nr:Fur family transcriptional regulator [Coraliomargarita akajimensis]ADE55050.1 ferric uptake regulator, Fur family [Coraliomargarita akajimensis DSM 45221]
MSKASILPQILDALKASGARMTKKRERILGALLTFDHPATAEEIRERAELPPTDLVTVYRNLETFESIHALQRIPLENGTQIFELTAPGEHYHHLICRECHKAERLDVCVGKEAASKARAKGFTEIAHVLEVYGICEDCSD